MSHYVKTFDSILQSTIWQEDSDTRIIWITLLILADQDGIIIGSIPGIAHTARVPIPKAAQALSKLSEPDLYSSSQDHEGRRIKKIDRGWEILNYLKYRDLMNPEEQKEKARLRAKRFRDRNARNVTRNAASRSVTLGNDSSTLDVDVKEELKTFNLSPPSSELTNGKSKKPDPRHQQFRKELETFWKYVNKGNPVPNWGPGDAGQLGRLLKEWPDLDLHGFQVWLLNYSNSDNINSLHLPKQFLPRLHEYADGPLDKYGKQGMAANA